MMEIYMIATEGDVYAYCSNKTLATRLLKEAEKDLPNGHPKIYTVNVMETLKDAGLEE